MNKPELINVHKYHSINIKTVWIRLLVLLLNGLAPFNKLLSYLIWLSFKSRTCAALANNQLSVSNAQTCLEENKQNKTQGPDLMELHGN